jgi:hypothetical protein
MFAARLVALRSLSPLKRCSQRTHKQNLIACGAGPSTQLNRRIRRAGAAGAAPYIANSRRFFSYSLALPRPAVLQLSPAGARGIRGVRLALSCQEAWY